MDPLKLELQKKLESLQRNKANTEPLTSQDENIYDCPECEDREILLIQTAEGWAAKPCHCKQIKAIKRMFKNSGLTDIQRQMRLDNFKPNKYTAEMYMACKSYVNDFPAIRAANTYSKGVGLTGSVGIGKTHLLCGIANELLEKKIPVMFISTTNLIAELYSAMSSDRVGQDLNDKIERISNVEVVIFDDVGKEKITEWVQAQYYRIINNRYVKCLPTLFSSNCDMNEIAEKVGDAVASRLYELTKGRYFYVEAPDYRVR